MKEFEYIAKDIISNERFLSLKNEPHHGITRYDHIMHVAKCTYKIAKGLHLDYVAATRGALLHDYFNDSEYDDVKGIKRGSIHPAIALNNAKKDFILSKKEENIIASHMYPFGKVKPNCKESWIVTTVDKSVAIYECTRYKFKEELAFLFILAVNFMHF
jgi:uncharacterized protein